MRPDARAFDFDDWADLARRDGDAFESRRLALIERCIDEASEPSRLRHLQWRIEMERRRTRTPLHACLKLSSMMWDTVLDDERGLRGALSALGEMVHGEIPAAPEPGHGARVYRFPRRRPER